jgi:hypothetical protein
MPRFYFDVAIDGQTELDSDGIELSGAALARHEAVHAAVKPQGRWLSLLPRATQKR